MGLANLGAWIVYQIMAGHRGMEVHRLFLGDVEEGFSGISLEDQTGRGIDPHSFHILAFSVSFENDLLYVPLLLARYGIPVHAMERGESDPIIVMGGIVPSSNPEAVAAFVDLFLLGEAEAYLVEFLDFLEEIAGKYGRKELLEAIQSRFVFAYVPSLYMSSFDGEGNLIGHEPVSLCFPKKVLAPKYLRIGSEEQRPCAGEQLPRETVFKERVIMELGRGCARGCRFCLAGHVYRPPRWYSLERVLEAVGERSSAGTVFGLMAPSISDMPGLIQVLGHMAKEGIGVSISSLRVDSIDIPILEALRACGQRTITIALEAGTERLRRVINKHIKDEQIFQKIELIARAGFSSLRLYFMLGLPTETREDVESIAGLTKRIRHILVKTMGPSGRVSKIKVSISSFVPKPFTPFQWAPMLDINSLKERQKWVVRALLKEGGIDVTTDVPKWAYVQCLLARGDRRVSGLIIEGNLCEWDLKRLRAKTILNPDYFVTRERSPEEVLPWDFIEHGIRKSYLFKEYRLSMKAMESSGCDAGHCIKCGVCEVIDA